MNNRTEELIALFKETHAAHHHAFIEVDGADPEWPAWYAAHTLERMEEILGVELTLDRLTSLFEAADEAHRNEAPEADWHDYYARYFLRQTEDAGPLD